MQLKTNSLLQSGKYRIIRLLGQGGFGITYLAENTMLGKQVAIKEFFPKDFCGRDNTSHLTLGTQNNADTVSKLKARFIKEAQNIAKLDHPGIVHIHDIFEENNTAYYVMDYIEGENLNEIVKHNGPLPEGKAVKYVEKVGEALEYIHSRNMTHFDVKPANIVIRRKDDQPILIDFGLSKQYDAHGDATSTLMQGISQGYSPIELYNYGSVSTFSPQTDVYSLGATLLFLISGKVPPQPSSIIEEGLDLSPVADAQLKTAIESAMQVGRTKRPESVESLISLLSGSQDSQERDGKPQISDYEGNQVNDENTLYININGNYENGVKNTSNAKSQSNRFFSKKGMGWGILFITLIGIGISLFLLLKDRDPSNQEEAQVVADKIVFNTDSLTAKDYTTMLDYIVAYTNEIQPYHNEIEAGDSIIAMEKAIAIANRYKYVDMFLDELIEAEVNESDILSKETIARMHQMSDEYSAFPFQYYKFNPKNPKQINNFQVKRMGLCNYYGEVNAQGIPDGLGRASFNSEEALKYEGYWAAGVPHGYGEYELVNGDVFRGDFIKGEYDHGRYFNQLTGEYFQGRFSNGTPSEGTWYDINGNVLETIN